MTDAAQLPQVVGNGSSTIAYGPGGGGLRPTMRSLALKAIRQTDAVTRNMNGQHYTPAQSA